MPPKKTAAAKKPAAKAKAAAPPEPVQPQKPVEEKKEEKPVDNSDQNKDDTTVCKVDNHEVRDQQGPDESNAAKELSLKEKRLIRMHRFAGAA